MKEFEKWWRNLGIVYQTNPLLSPKDRTKRGYRAALEWVLSNRGRMRVTDEDEYVDTSIIHKELEE